MDGVVGVGPTAKIRRSGCSISGGRKIGGNGGVGGLVRLLKNYEVDENIVRIIIDGHICDRYVPPRRE